MSRLRGGGEFNISPHPHPHPTFTKTPWVCEPSKATSLAGLNTRCWSLFTPTEISGWTKKSETHLVRATKKRALINITPFITRIRPNLEAMFLGRKKMSWCSLSNFIPLTFALFLGGKGVFASCVCSPRTNQRTNEPMPAATNQRPRRLHRCFQKGRVAEGCAAFALLEQGL